VRVEAFRGLELVEVARRGGSKQRAAEPMQRSVLDS
jgi:hypothetical protein